MDKLMQAFGGVHGDIYGGDKLNVKPEHTDEQLGGAALLQAAKGFLGSGAGAGGGGGGSGGQPPNLLNMAMDEGKKLFMARAAGGGGGFNLATIKDLIQNLIAKYFMQKQMQELGLGGAESSLVSNLLVDNMGGGGGGGAGGLVGGLMGALGGGGGGGGGGGKKQGGGGGGPDIGQLAGLASSFLK